MKLLLYLKRVWGYLAVLLVLVVIMFVYDIYSSRFFYENDAFIEAPVIPISSVVSGNVVSISVIDFQKVELGQSLFTVDPKPYQLALETAKANLAKAEQDRREIVRDIEHQQQIINEQQLAVDYNKKTWDRYDKLIKSGAISKSSADQVYFDYQSSQVVLEEAKSALNKLKATLGDPTATFPAIATAQTEIKQAEYDLSHTTTRAPSDGYLTRFGTNVGEYIVAGEQEFAIINSDQWWVYVRVKESDLPRFKEGDKATIWVDMLPNTTLTGTVSGIAWGVNRHQDSGDAMTYILPYLKQEENWLRLDQRFPVRVSIDTSSIDVPLRVGASASVLVRNK